MPGDHKEYVTSLKVSGGIDEKLKSSLKEMSKQILGIGKHAKQAGHEGKAGFGELKESVEKATEKVEFLKEAVTELLAPILAVSGAFLSIKGVLDVLSEASDKFKEAREAAGSFQATLAGTFFLSTHPDQLDRYTEEFKKQMEEAGAANKGLFDEEIFQKIDQELVARANLGPPLTEKLTEGIPAMVARMNGGNLRSVTEESVGAMADLIAKGVQTGKVPKGLLLNPAERKAFSDKNSTKEDRVNIILRNAMFKGGMAYLDEQGRKNPEEYKLLQEQVKTILEQRKLGKDWIKVTDEIAITSEHAKQTFMDILDNAITPITPVIESALAALDTGIRNVGSWEAWLFKDPKTIGDKLTQTLNSSIDAVKKYAQDNGMGWLAGDIVKLQAVDWTDVWKSNLATLKEMGKLMADIGKMFDDISHNRGDWGADVLTLRNDLKTIFNDPKELQQKTQSAVQSMEDAKKPKVETDPTKLNFWVPPNSILDGWLKAGDAISKGTDATINQTEAAIANRFEQQKQAIQMENLNNAVEKTTGNDFYHLQLAIDLVTQSLLQLAGTFGFGAAGGAGGSGQAETQYGHVPGDQPGGPTYDYNSWHGIGSFGHLRAGDVAMHDAFAHAHGFSPGSTGPDPYHPGTMVRWQDHSGASNPANVDHYVPPMAKGGLVKQSTLAFLHRGEVVLGEKGISKGLSGLAGSSPHFAPNISLTMNVSGNNGEEFATQVAEIIQDKFQEIQNNAFHDFRRTYLA